MSKALELAKFGRESAPAGAVIGDTDTQTLSSKTFSDNPVFSGGGVNSITYLNGSKVLTSNANFVFDGANMGLGTNTPATKLHIGGAPIATSGALIYLRDTTAAVGTASLGGIAFFSAPGTDYYIAKRNTSAGATFLSFGNADNGTEYAVIDSAGNMGIGTSNVPYKLVVSSSGASGMEFGPAYSSTRNLFQNYSRSGATYVGLDEVAADFKWFIGGSAKMALDTNGYLGVGTTSPGYLLHVAGTLNAQGIQVSGTASLSFGASKWMVQQESGSASLAYYCGPDANTYGTHFLYRATSTGTPLIVMTYSPSGNVGVGNTAPAEKLEVTGKVRIFDGGYPYIDLGVATNNYFRIIHDNPSDLFKIGKNGAAAFMIDGAGNSYVNSSNPSAGINLYIRNTTDTGGDNTRYAGIQFQVGSDQGTAAIQAYRTNSASDYSTALAFLTKGTGAPATNPVERMRINSTGGVIIGDTAIQYSSKLYVNGAIAARHGGVDGTYQPAFIAGYTGNYNETNVIATSVSSGAGGSGFRFEVSNGAGSAARSSTVLFTRNQAQFNTQVSIGGNSLYFEKSGTRSWQLYANQSSGQAWLASGDGVGNFTIACDRVGIGESNPSEKLTVGGAIRSTSNAINFSGQVGSVFDYYASTARVAVYDGNKTATMSYSSDGDLRVQRSVKSGYEFTISKSTNGWSPNTWYEVLPPGTVSSGATYIVAYRWDHDGGGGPYIIAGSFLFSAVNTNGTGSDNTFVPLGASHTGGGYASFRCRAGMGASTGLDIQSTAWNSGTLTVRFFLFNYWY
jgi:hypothetical protein